MGMPSSYFWRRIGTIGEILGIPLSAGWFELPPKIGPAQRFFSESRPKHFERVVPRERTTRQLGRASGHGDKCSLNSKPCVLLFGLWVHSSGAVEDFH